MTGEMSRRLVVGGIVLDADQRILAARRTRPPALAGLWEFPGGKVEDGESPSEALRRELVEELEIAVTVHVPFPPGDGRAWPVDERHELQVWFCSLSSGAPTPGDTHDRVAWLHRDELTSLAWAPADEPIARALAEQ